jgi:hypothetical protein
MTLTSAPRMAGRPPALLDGDGIAVRETGDGPWLSARVRLTSYRSLPLSCLRELKVSLDGSGVDAGRVSFVLDGVSHRPQDLGDRIDLWWYILDSAELRVALPSPLTPGPHRLAVEMTTIVPFATGGQSTNTARSEADFHVLTDEENS